MAFLCPHVYFFPKTPFHLFKLWIAGEKSPYPNDNDKNLAWARRSHGEPVKPISVETSQVAMSSSITKTNGKIDFSILSRIIKL